MSNDDGTVFSVRREIPLDSIVHVRRPGASLGVKLELADVSDSNTPRDAMYKLSMYEGTVGKQRREHGVLGYMTEDGRLIPTSS